MWLCLVKDHRLLNLLLYSYMILWVYHAKFPATLTDSGHQDTETRSEGGKVCRLEEMSLSCLLPVSFDGPTHAVEDLPFNSCVHD